MLPAIAVMRFFPTVNDRELFGSSLAFAPILIVEVDAKQMSFPLGGAAALEHFPHTLIL